MTEKDVGQGAVLGFGWTEDAVGRWRDANNRNKVSEQESPKDENL